MLNARVVGTATSSIKHPSMEGLRLLVVQPYAADGSTPDGYPLLAVDWLGAGRNDEVVISSDGRFVQETLNSDATPVRWAVLGIIDA